jgi:hypothetical protein
MVQLGFSRKNRFPNKLIIRKVALLATKPILEHIIDASADLYFKDSGFDELMKVVKDVFKSQLVADAVKGAVEKFMDEGVQKAVELQRKKEQASSGRKIRSRK